MQKIKNSFYNKKMQDIIFIFFLSLPPLFWFRKNEILVGHDNVFPLNPIVFLAGRLSTWIEHGFGQSQDLIMGTIPIHLIDAIPYMLGLSLQATEMLVYVFWFVCIGISAYILALQFSATSRYFRLLAVLLYQFNFFLLQGWWIGERTKFSAYIAFPLILTIFIKVYKGELRVLYGAIINSLIFFIFNVGGLYGIPLYGGMFIGIGTFVVFFSLISAFDKKIFVARKLVLLTLLTILGYFIVSSYFIFPVLSKLGTEYANNVSKVGGVNGLVNWADVISASTSFMNLFRLQGIAEWYDNPDHPYSFLYLKNPFLVALSFVFPLLIFSSVFIRGDREKRKMILFFFLVFLIGMFFSAGTHPPSGFLFEVFMQKIPGFAAAFRSPYYKFAPSFFLASSFLIAILIDRFKGKTKKVLFVVMVVFVLGYHFPYFTGGIFSFKKGFSTRLSVPSYVYEFARWLNEEKKDEERMLLLPPNNPDLQYSAYDWGYLSFQSLPTLSSNKAVIVNNDRINDAERIMVEALYNALTRRDDQSINILTAHLGIGYLLLQNDAIAGESRSTFPLTAKSYQEIIENTLHLKPFRKFDRWVLYKIDSPLLGVASIFYTKDRATVVSGKIKDYSTYYDLTDNLQAIVGREDAQSLGSNIGGVSDIYYPNCLKCKKKNRPYFSYPKRNILPDSPFYPLVLSNEEQKLHFGDTKNLVYDYLGLTIKRFSEMKQMIEEDIQIKDIVLNRFEAMVRQIQTSFNKLARSDDKFDAAEDLSYYTDDMGTVVTIMLGDRVRTGLPVVIFTRVLASLGNLELAIQPYLFKPDITQNRLYNLTVDKSGMFDIYIRGREFEGVLKDKAKIKVQIDGHQQKERDINSNIRDPKWLMLSDIPLEKGDHTILLSFGEIVNLIGHFSYATTEFNSDGKTQCYIAKVNNFDSRKRYKTTIRYANNLLSDVNFYVWEEGEKGIRIRSADRLRPSLSEQEYTQDILPQGGIHGVTIGMCALGLTAEYLQERFDIRVREFVEPVIIFASKDLNKSSTREVLYKKASPTKYMVFFTTFNPNSMFVFPTRFDNGWDLQSFERRQVLVNGFENGWLIDKPGTYRLALEYKPQHIFRLGAIVSLSSVSIGILYILTIVLKRKRGKTNG